MRTNACKEDEKVITGGKRGKIFVDKVSFAAKMLPYIDAGLLKNQYIVMVKNTVGYRSV